MAARPGCSSSVPSLPPPCPKSPPEYPDLYGRRREAAKVQMLEREIGFLEEELKSLDGLQPASRCCKEVADFVVANSEPLVPTHQRGNKSCRFWKWLCGMSCFSLSWVCCCCCCCYSACPVHLELPCSCNCNSCSPCKCCSCPRCSVRKCRCFSCPKSDCCRGISCCSRCCTFSFPSCPSCSCCSWPSCSCSCCSWPRSSCCSWPSSSCLKCPKVSGCFSCNCKDICCDPCYLCY
ncbi:guanine nucleotide-binding protein subunit gamma 3 isoform X2 [Rhodamnia argentea]|uniref:Guanine nucleotide-binding protein subunit gamma 3 isoform X2 n=1 Tax=Rhodamnia argentea TaxID=178133 RepID=A0ABM3HA02_9MYRT|nr:guanine nucleotide-binding protein subunit gamma 3 isoform X2 [Rhodamnia argentea]